MSILQQSLRQDRERKLIAIIGPNNESSTINKKKRISELLKAEEGQIEAQACGAEEFLVSHLTIASLSKFFASEEDLFPESPDFSEV